MELNGLTRKMCGKCFFRGSLVANCKRQSLLCGVSVESKQSPMERRSLSGMRMCWDVTEMGQVGFERVHSGRWHTVEFTSTVSIGVQVKRRRTQKHQNRERQLPVADAGQRSATF